MKLPFFNKLSTASILIVPIALGIISIVTLYRIQKVEIAVFNDTQTRNILLKVQQLVTRSYNFNLYFKDILVDQNSQFPKDFRQRREDLVNRLVNLKKSNTKELIPSQQIDSILVLITKNLTLFNEIDSIKSSGKISGNKQAYYLAESTSFLNTLQSLSNKISEYQIQLLETQKRVSEKQFFRLKVGLYLSLSAILLSLFIIIRKTKSDRTNQKETNSKLIYFAKMVEKTNDAIFLMNQDLIIQIWNKGAENLYGYLANEAIGKKSLDLLKIETPLINLDNFNFQKNSFSKNTATQFRKDGKEILVDISISYTMENNLSGYFLIIASDITEKEKKEIRINRLATIAESTNDAIYITDQTDIITFWNKGAVKLYGFTTAEALYKKSYELLQVSTSLFNQEETFKNNDLTNFKEETSHHKKNGELIIVSISVTPIKNENIKSNGFIFVTQDITEIKRLEGILKNLNENLEIQVDEKTSEIKDTFERITDGFVALDKNWNYTYANKKAEEILKRGSGYLVGKNLMDEFPDPDQHFYKAYQKAFDTQQYVYFEDFYEPFNFWLENHIYPSPKGITIYFRDITKQKKAQEDLVKLNYKFRSLSNHLQNSREEERINIAREIHDDLGQLSTALKMDMSWIRKNIDSENLNIKSKLDDSINLLDEMAKSVRRIAQELRPSILDNLGLSAAIEWYLNDFEKRTGIKCRFSNELEEGNNLPANLITSLFRICQESLTNVMRHAEATEVECSLIRISNKIYLSIRDNGKGFDPNQKRKSFGLLGMQERAIMINGQLKIESSPGKGSSINVQIEL